MGRTHIAAPEPIFDLSILDEHGQLDREMEPTIPEEILGKMYRAMLLGRRFDEKMLELQRTGRIGTFPPIKGQEAAQIGSVIHLGENDWFVPSFRETAAEIMRGRSMESVLLYYNGYNEGTLIPPAQRDLPMSVPVGSQILHAVGLGYAAKYRRSGEVVMAIFGDGATSEGDFHEALNCAAVYQCPVVFVCQNNQWAISIPLAKQTRSRTIAEKALAYNLPAMRVDGNDILAVYVAAAEAVARARSGGGPTLIECVTYRIMMHTTADDPKKYRSDEEVEPWRQRDPLTRFSAYLAEKGVLNTTNKERLDEEVREEIRLAIDKAESRMRDLGQPLDMFEHVFAEMTPQLRRQREQLAGELAAVKEVDHG
jgi:pyruvate dehydrogenase E1 component alpha subunit